MGADDTTGEHVAVASTLPTNLVFFDGDCGLCHASVRFALARDGAGLLRFAPLHGETYRALAPAFENHAFDFEHPPDSLILLQSEGVSIRSTAVVKLLEVLDPPWPTVARLLALTPRSFRDLGYRLVAMIRRWLFAPPSTTCPLVPIELRTRFLP